jgi:hypothetical protein
METRDTKSLCDARHTEVCAWRFGASAECDCGLAERQRREDFSVVRQALIDSGTMTSGPYDGALHPVAREALDALERLANA